MAVPLDQLVVAAVVVAVVLGGMRLFYGAWPWEAGKTWYRTRQAVEYVASLRNGKGLPALRLVLNVTNTARDSFDRRLCAHDTSPPEAAPSRDAKDVAAPRPTLDPQPVAQRLHELLVQKRPNNLPRVWRRWPKSARRTRPSAIDETSAPLTVGDSRDEG